MDAYTFPRVCRWFSRLWNHFNLLKFHLRKSKDLACVFGAKQAYHSCSAHVTSQQVKPESQTALLPQNMLFLPPPLLASLFFLCSWTSVPSWTCRDGVSSAAELRRLKAAAWARLFKPPGRPTSKQLCPTFTAPAAKATVSWWNRFESWHWKGGGGGVESAGVTVSMQTYGAWWAICKQLWPGVTPNPAHPY